MFGRATITLDIGPHSSNNYRPTIRDCNNQMIPLERGIQVLDFGVCFDKWLGLILITAPLFRHPIEKEI